MKCMNRVRFGPRIDKQGQEEEDNVIYETTAVIFFDYDSAITRSTSDPPEIFSPRHNDPLKNIS